MFKVRLKASCSLIFLSAQLKKWSFIFKSVLLVNNEKIKMMKCEAVVANCVGNNRGKFCKKILS